VTLVDPAVGRLFMNSDKARAEFADRSAQVRQAISLGRRFQDPLAEIAGLWTEHVSASGKRLTGTRYPHSPSLPLHAIHAQSALSLVSNLRSAD
jgi:hypothetical protein